MIRPTVLAIAFSMFMKCLRLNAWTFCSRRRKRRTFPSTALQTDLDDWFERKKRGRGSRVFVFPRKDAVWFMIRHGDPYKREGIFEGKEPVAFFQPEKYDVLVYDPSLGDIRMNASSQGGKDLYRRKFGLHVFGNEDFFTVRKKYTLEPLRKGDASIACEDVTGSESVTLKQIHFSLGGAQREVEIRQAK